MLETKKVRLPLYHYKDNETLMMTNLIILKLKNI